MNIHDNNPELPSKRISVKREKITQKEIDEINALHRSSVEKALESVQSAIKCGGMLVSIKGRLKHGQWGKWAERNLNFTIRTAVRYMTAYEKRAALYDTDPVEFMAMIWGHKAAEIEDKSDAGHKSDAASDLEGGNEDGEKEGEDEIGDSNPEKRPADWSIEKWTGFLLIRSLNQALDEFVQQPISDPEKLDALLEVYDALITKIDGIAKKLDKTLKQALTAHTAKKTKQTS